MNSEKRYIPAEKKTEHCISRGDIKVVIEEKTGLTEGKKENMALNRRGN